MSDSPETKDVPSYHAGVGRAPIAWQAVTGSCSGFLANRFEAGFAKFRLGSLCSVRLGGKPRLGACRRCPGGGRLRASAEAEEPQRASQGRWGTFDDVRCATCAALIIIILLCPPPRCLPLGVSDLHEGSGSLCRATDGCRSLVDGRDHLGFLSDLRRDLQSWIALRSCG